MTCQQSARGVDILFSIHKLSSKVQIMAICFFLKQALHHDTVKQLRLFLQANCNRLALRDKIYFMEGKETIECLETTREYGK